MKLHHFAHSSASYRVRLALALKQVDVEFCRVDMPNLAQQTDEYETLNPQRMVPCLELEDGRIIGQSLAIIDYLDRHVVTPRLYPEGSADRASAQSLALLIACDTSPIQAKIVQRFLMDDMGLSEAQNHAWLTKWIVRGLEPVEAFLQNREIQSAFAMGDSPGIVDICIIPQLRNANRFGVDVSHFTSLLALNETCLSHPAFQWAHPDAWE